MNNADEECGVFDVANGLGALIRTRNRNRQQVIDLLESYYRLIIAMWPDHGYEYCLSCGRHGFPVSASLMDLFGDVCKLYSSQQVCILKSVKKKRAFCFLAFFDAFGIHFSRFLARLSEFRTFCTPNVHYLCPSPKLSSRAPKFCPWLGESLPHPQIDAWYPASIFVFHIFTGRSSHGRRAHSRRGACHRHFAWKPSHGLSELVFYDWWSWNWYVKRYRHKT